MQEKARPQVTVVKAQVILYVCHSFYLFDIYSAVHKKFKQLSIWGICKYKCFIRAQSKYLNMVPLEFRKLWCTVNYSHANPFDEVNKRFYKVLKYIYLTFETQETPQSIPQISEPFFYNSFVEPC